LLALTLGWACWRWLRRLPGVPPPGVHIPVLGVAGLGVWALVLDTLAIPATPLSQGAPVAILVAASLRTPRSDPGGASRTGPWAVAAAAAAIPSAILTAGRPAAGWDFRYIWGLKAAVFAQSGRHDPSWLSWPANRFAHPDYPPLWSDLIATSVRFGASPAEAAAAWQAVLVLALAASCWHAARGATPPVRALAAAVGAWIPVVSLPVHGGYADTLVAFLLAAALAALPEMLRGSSGGVVGAAVAATALALAKNEGIALAAGLGLLAVVPPVRRRSWPVLASAAGAILAWRSFVWCHGISGEAIASDGARIAAHLREFPAALGASLSLSLVLVVSAWLLVVAAFVSGREVRPLIVPSVWLAATLAAYLATPHDLAWHVRWSLDRVLAAPLPGFIALALGSTWSPHRGARPAPGMPPGATPSA
jgi:hypothetical protein